jgi:hypothetical protein
MAKVRVYNDNVFDHVEKFKGTMLKIPTKGFIEMDREDAVQFKSQFRAPIYDKGGIQTRESMKMIRLEKMGAEEVKQEPEFVCQKCGFQAKSQAGLAAHIRANHVESMIDDDAKKELQAGG